MIEASNAVEQACRRFLEQDDTPVQLSKNLVRLTKLKGNVGERMQKVVKDLNAIKNMFKAYSKQQGDLNLAKLKNGANFFENICQVDAAKMERTLDEEVAELQGKIAKEKEGRDQRLKDRLADLFLKIGGGEIYELAAKKMAPKEAERRAKEKAEAKAKKQEEIKAKEPTKKDAEA